MTQFDQRYQQVENQFNAGRDVNIFVPPSLTAAQHRRNRNAMLTKVRSRWITGVFEQSLNGATFIELRLHEQMDAVANPWEQVLHLPDQPLHPLSFSTSIAQIYDNAGGELLIL